MIQKLCVINKQHSVASSSLVWDAATPSPSPSPSPFPSLSLCPLSCKLCAADCPVPETGCTVYSPNPQSRNPQATNHSVTGRSHAGWSLSPPPPRSLVYALRSKGGGLFQLLSLDWFAEQAKYKIFSVSIRSICFKMICLMSRPPWRCVRDYTGITARRHAQLFPRRTPAETRAESWAEQVLLLTRQAM